MQLVVELRRAPHMVGNADNGAPSYKGVDWALLQQQQAVKSERLFQMLAEQQWAELKIGA